MSDEERWMRLALDAAARGRGLTSPNPMVGAVVVRDGVVIATGFHARAGGPHAEIVALDAAGAAARGATMVVTLEPCCHTGRTGPCTEALIHAGIARVVVGATDPNPHVTGGGVGVLRRAGLTVSSGVLSAECEAQNEVFRHWVTTGRPFVTLKLAQSLDGRIAAPTGDSRWVSGPEARAEVHAMRAAHDAVMVGSGTALADDPQLTARDAEAPGGQPMRVLVDGRLRVPPSARLFDDAAAVGVVVATALSAAHPAAMALAERGATLLSLPDTAGDARQVDVAALMDALGALQPRPVTSLLVEGGGGLASALVKADRVDRIRLYVAPRLVGADGLAGLGPLGLSAMADAPRFDIDGLSRVGDDARIDAVRRERREGG